MHPRLDQLPRLGPAELCRPALADQPGVRVAGVTQHGGGMCFRAEGEGLAPGIYLEVEGLATPLLADGEERYTQPVSLDEQPRSAIASATSPEDRSPTGCARIAHPRLGARLACAAIRAGRSAPDAFLVGVPGAMARVPGQSLGHSPSGRHVAVADLAAGCLRALGEGDTAPRVVAELSLKMDPLLAPLIGVSDDGVAYLMDARLERGDAGLCAVDLASGNVERLLDPLPAPSWITAAPLCAGAVALCQQLGDAPRARLYRLPPRAAPVELGSWSLAQPAELPLPLGERWLLCQLSLTPYPLATHGPVELVAISTDGKAQAPLYRGAALPGRLRLAGDAVLIEGGAALLRLPLLG